MIVGLAVVAAMLIATGAVVLMRRGLDGFRIRSRLADRQVRPEVRASGARDGTVNLDQLPDTARVVPDHAAGAVRAGQTADDQGADRGGPGRAGGAPRRAAARAASA